MMMVAKHGYLRLFWLFLIVSALLARVNAATLRPIILVVDLSPDIQTPDTSGQTRLQGAIQAIQNFLPVIAQEAPVGLVTSCHLEGETTAPVTDVAPLLDVVARFSTCASFNSIDAMERGIEHLSDGGTLIFLVNGQLTLRADTPATEAKEGLIEAIREAKERHGCLYVVPMGNSSIVSHTPGYVDAEEMQDLADITIPCGSAFEAQSANTYLRTFMEVYLKSVRANILVSEQRQIFSGSTIRLHSGIPVPEGVSVLRLDVFWGKGQVKIELQKPANSSEAEIAGWTGTGYSTSLVKDPAAGIWKVELTGDNIDTEGQQVTVIASQLQDIPAFLVDSPATVAPLETTVILPGTATLIDTSPTNSPSHQEKTSTDAAPFAPTASEDSNFADADTDATMSPSVASITATANTPATKKPSSLVGTSDELTPTARNSAPPGDSGIPGDGSTNNKSSFMLLAIIIIGVILFVIFMPGGLFQQIIKPQNPPPVPHPVDIYPEDEELSSIADASWPFHNEDGSRASPESASGDKKSSALSPTVLPPSRSGLARSTLPSVALIFLNGPQENVVIPIDSPIFTIGRREGNMLQILDPQVSREQARIFYEETPGLFVLENVGNRNILVNDQIITEPVPLYGDETIQIGRTYLQFKQIVT